MTAALRLVTSGGYDHLRDLADGTIAVEGVAVSVDTATEAELFYRFEAHPDWDAFEMSMAKYANLVSRGRRDYLALPVFLGRSFRHGSIFIRSAAISTPADLEGATIGISDWTQTTAIYARAVLMHECGLQLNDMNWVQGGVERPNRGSIPAPDLQGIRCTSEPDRALSDMLLEGKIDALIATQPPAAWMNGDRRIGRLFEDPVPVEDSYFRRTGIFPIMHTLALRRDVVERQPGLPLALYSALLEAKRLSEARLQSHDGTRYPLPWLSESVWRARRSFGADAWPYGIAANQQTLEAFLRFAWEQQTLARPVSVDELFLDVDRR